MSTQALEFAALCLGILVLGAVGSPEAADHPRLWLFGVFVSLVGFGVIVLSALSARRK